MSSKHLHEPFMVILSSPSGAGKTSICREVVRRDRNICYSVSATTRPRRRGERHGTSYLFYTEDEFQRLIDQNALLEHAAVYGYYYGTPKKPIEKAFGRGRDVIADLDIQGMRSCKKALGDRAVGIFILPPNQKELFNRLKQRNTENRAELARRRAALPDELRAIPWFDYLVINDKLEEAVGDVLTIIRAERLRTSRRRRLKEVSV
ncbi:MAG: guanylate kinase [bacterium]